MDTILQKYMGDHRNKLLAGEIAKTEQVHLPSALQTIWSRNRKAGIDPDLDHIPNMAQHQHLNLPDRNVAFFEYMQDLSNKYYAALLETLEFLHLAVFSITAVNNDFLVFHSMGDPATLSTLASIGLDIGTSFSVDKIGTTAVSMALEKNTPVWTIGSENYHRFFRDYALLANPNTDKTLSHRHQDLVELFVFSMSGYNEYLENIAFGLAQYINAASGQNHLPHTIMKDITFTRLLEKSGVSLILINSDDKIVELNHRASRLFNLSFEDYAYRKCTEVFPELEPFFEPGKQRKRSLDPIHFEKPDFNAHVELSPTSIKGKFIGTSILIKSADPAKLESASVQDTKAHYSFDNIIGGNNRFRAIIDAAKQTARSSSSILLEGENGTGKELLARAIHNDSPRKKEPFITVDCAGIPKLIIDSYLFGNIEKVFSDKQEGESIGKLEQAHKGTVFLNAVDELPLQTQSTLAGVLRSGEISRIGSGQSQKIDIRIIASTDKDLMLKAAQGEFRAELFYLIQALEFKIPPLRSRIDDVPLLARHFVRIFNRQLNKSIRSISSETMDCLQSYSWPGNIRELRNALEQCVNFEDSDTITHGALPTGLRDVSKQTDDNTSLTNDPPPPLEIAILKFRGSRKGFNQKAHAKTWRQ
ncbi:MAG: sigma 54-interacting transcriptional regulator [Coriobacteriales bacterium]|jgi:transcriptional regulator with PAS, ATPase and Fis domain|nr:sigma 54-interacting transcriptional regulator [Coriobacteriales bacterium]